MFLHKFAECGFEQLIPEGTITSVRGFMAAGIHCGLKKKRKDLALIYSDVPCSAAGTFTLNKVRAAPNVISKNIVEQQSKVRAILVNSGNANACTGTKGFENARVSQSYLAKKLSINPSEVIISSTGVIGQQLPIEKLLSGIDKIIPELSENGGDDASEAILTTDLKKKSYAVKVQLLEGEVTVGGICKGSGMIMPNMATMLVFLTTDASVESSVLQKLLTNSVDQTFNKISVDGETSTNDMVILLANGVSKIKVNEGTENYSTFLNGLIAICSEMAKAIVADGEGATKLITVSVNNAKTKEDADAVAKAVANSPLVKTAMNGNDANWGRILSAAGNSGVDFKPDKVTIKFDDLPILLPNYNVDFNEDEAKRVLNKNEVEKVFLVPMDHFLKQKPEEYTVKLEVHPSYTDENGKKVELLPVQKLGLPSRYSKPWKNGFHRILVYNSTEEVIWGITAEIVFELCRMINSSK